MGKQPNQASRASSVLGLAYSGSSDAGSFKISFKTRTTEATNMDRPDSFVATPAVDVDVNVDLSGCGLGRAIQAWAWMRAADMGVDDFDISGIDADIDNHQDLFW